MPLKAPSLKLSENLQEIFQKLFEQKLNTVQPRTDARVGLRVPFDGKAGYIHKSLEESDSLNWLLTQKIRSISYDTFIFFQTLRGLRIFIDSLFPACCFMRTIQVITMSILCT